MSRTGHVVLPSRNTDRFFSLEKKYFHERGRKSGNSVLMKRSRSHSNDSNISVLTDNSVRDLRYKFDDGRRCDFNYSNYHRDDQKRIDSTRYHHNNNKNKSNYDMSYMSSNYISNSSSPSNCFRNLRCGDEDLSKSKKQRPMTSDEEVSSVHYRQVSPSPSSSVSHSGSCKSLSSVRNNIGTKPKGGFIELPFSHDKPCDFGSDKHPSSSPVVTTNSSGHTQSTVGSGLATHSSGPRFSDLPLEWWEREEGCKAAKSAHMDRVDNICYSREDLVLLTTLWESDIVLECNMFPYQTPYGVEHFTLWSIKDLTHDEVQRNVDSWLAKHYPQVRRWQYDDNSGERSIDLFHVHVFVEMIPFAFHARPEHLYLPPHLLPPPVAETNDEDVY